MKKLRRERGEKEREREKEIKKKLIIKLLTIQSKSFVKCPLQAFIIIISVIIFVVFVIKIKLNKSQLK